MAIPKQRDLVAEAFKEANELADKAIDDYEARVRAETGKQPASDPRPADHAAAAT